MAKTYTCRVKTKLSYDELEAVLARTSKAQFEIAFDGLEEVKKGASKIIRIIFKDSQDRARLFASCIGARPK